MAAATATRADPLDSLRRSLSEGQTFRLRLALDNRPNIFVPVTAPPPNCQWGSVAQSQELDRAHRSATVTLAELLAVHPAPSISADRLTP
jgi:hypothetical protein